MTRRARHLREDRLLECYLAERGDEPIDPRAAEHLADCLDCRAQYSELSSFLTGLRSEGDAEIDAIYSADDLRSQQQQIAHRIEHLGHHARVINFPHHEAGGRISRVSHVAPRWLAAAAAAGLLIGVGVGSFLEAGAPGVRAHARQPAIAVPFGNDVNVAKPAAAESPRQAPEPAAPPPLAQPADGNDEFMSELEFALDRPRTRELLALDDLTPHVRGVTVSQHIQ